MEFAEDGEELYNFVQNSNSDAQMNKDDDFDNIFDSFRSMVS